MDMFYKHNAEALPPPFVVSVFSVGQTFRFATRPALPLGFARIRVYLYPIARSRGKAEALPYVS